MADFRKAFQVGLEASEEADRAREEIFRVLDDFATQVHEASGGRIRVERRALSKSSVFAHMKRFEDPTAPIVTADVLVACGGEQEKPMTLGEYELGERGYPVKLLYSRENVHCHDRAALEHELQNLLEHPDTGRKLRRLMEGERAA